MIKTHQELLEAYYQARRTVISETSGSIDEDHRQLVNEVAEYSVDHNLSWSFVNDDAPPYWI